MLFIMNSIEMLLEILFSIDLFSYPLGLYILYIHGYIQRMHNKNKINIYIYIHISMVCTDTYISHQK